MKKTWRHPCQRDLLLFALSSEELKDGKKKRIREHVDACPSCDERVEGYQHEKLFQQQDLIPCSAHVFTNVEECPSDSLMEQFAVLGQTLSPETYWQIALHTASCDECQEINLSKACERAIRTIPPRKLPPEDIKKNRKGPS